MEIINMTPHDIVVDDGVNKNVYPTSGTVARIEMDTETVYDIDGFNVVKHEVVGDNLPAEEHEVFIIVSSMVLSQYKGRRFDLLAPNTNKATRNDKGHIVSVPGFVAN